jgi:tRNA-specific 2-thiouridylase
MKIAILLSGGVDSSVVLSLLAKEGCHDLTAFYLKIWLEDELSYLGECPWEEDLKYAKAVCDQLNVPLEIVSLQQEYNDLVVSYTLDELRAGRTPSPDIFCNQRIKFGAFLDHIDSSFDFVASGHYASTKQVSGKTYLCKGVDPIKDQTYFLSHLSQKQISRCLFPLGSLHKKEVRDLANKMNLPTKDRSDSQGICFLGKIKYDEFVKFHLGERPGEIREWGTENILGTHKGFWFHTNGQRKGLRLHGGPWYVVDKSIKENIVYVSHETNQPSRQRKNFIATSCHWIAEEPKEGQTLEAKLRHGPNTIACVLTKLDSETFSVLLETPDPGLAEGQFSVFYSGSVCLGSGKISLKPIENRTL